MVFTLPMWLLEEGYKMFAEAMKKNNDWSRFLYYAFVFLSLTFLMLYLAGYR